MSSPDEDCDCGHSWEEHTPVELDGGEHDSRGKCSKCMCYGPHWLIATKGYPKVCCVCHHELDVHIDETKWWRCHSLDSCLYQCECRLLKEIAEEEGISFFKISKREIEKIGEFKQDMEKLSAFKRREA